MKILPVVDLLGGVAVRAWRGERNRYRPLVAPPIAEPTARCVGQFLSNTCGYREVYVADLDLLQGGSANRAAWEELIEARLAIWLDAGVTTADHGLATFEPLAKCSPRNRLIAGLETLAGPDHLASLVGRLGCERVVFSLDLRSGEPLYKDEHWLSRSPAEIARQAADAGCRTVIVLDLADVGTGRGLSTLPLVASLCGEHPQIEWWVGGGIAGECDLTAAAAAGASGCLVGSALYDGRIRPECP